jgi:hypothetical protein
MAAREPLAYAKIATRMDNIPPFYITEEYVKARDETGHPTRIEVILGRYQSSSFAGFCFQTYVAKIIVKKHGTSFIPCRSPQPGGPVDEFDADFHIGHRMKISRRHAMIYWSHEKQCFELKSICKNAVRVNGENSNTRALLQQ